MDHQSSLTAPTTTTLLNSAANLLWPDFVLHEERIYLDNAPDHDDYLELLIVSGFDKTTVQALYNHRHLLELVQALEPEVTPTRDELIALGKQLQAMWQAKLQQDFPDRPVIVAFDVEDGDPLDDLQLVIYEEESE